MYSNKIFHLQDNQYVCGYRTGCKSIDIAKKRYQIEKLRSNQMYKDIFLQYQVGFAGSNTLYPVEFIDNFDGFEDEDFPKNDGDGWYLAICEQSRFCKQHPNAPSREYFGPDINWYRDSMIWWEENEKNDSILNRLAYDYVEFFYCFIPEFKKIKGGIRLNNLNNYLINYIVNKFGVNYLIKLVNTIDIFKGFYIFYLREISYEIHQHDIWFDKRKLICEEGSEEYEIYKEQYNSTEEIIKMIQI